MFNKIKKGLVVTLAAALMAACFTGCGQNEIDSKETVAKLGEEEIPMGVAALYTRYEQAEMYNVYTMYFGTANIFDQIYDEETMETYGDNMKESVMTSLEKLYTLKVHAAEYGVELTEEELAEIDAVAEEFVQANADVLAEIGTAKEEVAEYLSLYKYEEKMYDAMTADVDTTVTEEEAARSKVTYVRISLEGTEKDEEGNVIPLTDAEKKAKADLAAEVLDKVVNAEDPATADWDTLVKEVDESLYASEYTFNEEDNVLDPVVNEAIDGLKDGTVVDKVLITEDETELYVVRFDAEVDEEATAKEKENIIATRRGEDFEAELNGWLESSDFTVVEDVWAKIAVNDRNIYLNFAAEETAE